MHKYAVGELFHPNVRKWQEMPEYNFRGGGHELVLYYTTPTAREVREIKSGVAQFALLVRTNMLFLLYKFGMNNWEDAGFNWHRVPEADRDMVPESEAPLRRHILTVFLVDADTGILKVIRVVSFAPEFAQALNAAINDQAMRPYDAAAVDRELQEAHRLYPTSDAMLNAASIRCVGGRE